MDNQRWITGCVTAIALALIAGYTVDHLPWRAPARGGGSLPAAAGGSQAVVASMAGMGMGGGSATGGTTGSAVGPAQSASAGVTQALTQTQVARQNQLAADMLHEPGFRRF